MDRRQRVEGDVDHHRVDETDRHRVNAVDRHHLVAAAVEDEILRPHRRAAVVTQAVVRRPIDETVATMSVADVVVEVRRKGLSVEHRLS